MELKAKVQGEVSKVDLRNSKQEHKGGHIKCTCSNAHNLGTNQEEAEIQMQCQTCDIIEITEMLRG